MLVLGIETATDVSSVALWRETEVASIEVTRGRGHVEFLIPSIVELCARAKVGMGDVRGVAAGLGPGSFTSMRVGVATAKSLAQVLQVPIAGISSLDALAFAARGRAARICACIDARRGEVYAAVYRATRDGIERETEYAARRPDDLARDLAERAPDSLVVGPGVFPTATAVAELGRARLARGEATPLAMVEPLYVRRSDAEIKWEQRGVMIERPLRVRGKGPA